jgi:tetratricopeptide (TPR) repeat protein
MLEADPSLDEVPDTLQGVVAARIDALPAAEKALLQQAAVLGKVFWTDALTALADLDERLLEDRLYALERKEFMRREQRSAVAGARQYVFVHALVRDGAYGQMPRPVRAQAHERVAQWIDSLAADRAEDRSEMLAHHLLHAVELRRAAGLDVTELLPTAARALREAGDRAWALGAPDAALESYERSLALDPSAVDDPYLLLRIGRARFIVRAEGEDELERAASALAETDSSAAAEAEIARGELVWQRGDQEGGFRHFDRAAALVEQLPPSVQKGWVVAQLARFLALAGRNREGRELAEQAIAVAEELGDTELLGDAYNTRGVVRSATGEEGWVEDFERSLALANSSWRAQRAYLNLGSTLFNNAGELGRAAELTRESLQVAERRGAPISQRWCRGNLAELDFHLGRWDESLQLLERVIEDPEPHYLKSICRLFRAHIRFARGDRVRAAADSHAAVAGARAIRDPQALIPSLSAHAFLFALLGDLPETKRALAELAQARRALESPHTGEWVMDYAFALLELGREAELLAEGDDLGLPTPWRGAALSVARGELVEAADALGALKAATREAHTRLRAAARLGAEGRRIEAEEQLRRALMFYRSVGAVTFISEGEALLAAAS